jgi:hypothetical protein
MPRYEYKVVPAPSKGIKGKGVRGSEARFSYAIQELMNGMAGYGWEYQRAETLPSVERSGLTGSTTEWRNLLVFRRPRADDASEFRPELLPAPASASEPPKEDGQGLELSNEPVISSTGTPFDNGVEDSATNTDIGPSLSILARARSKAAKTDAAPPPDAPDLPKP